MKPLLFRVIPTALVLIGLGAAFLWLRPGLTAVERGRALNRAAWEASFTERGLPVPETGPREGYSGARLAAKTQDPELGWRETPVSVPDLLRIDAEGCQHYDAVEEPRHRVLILGGSVAFGAYASSIETTYFHRLGRALEARGLASDVTVFAAGAWKSVQEVNALARYAPRLRPDLVVFLDGLNDLTNGPTAESLFGARVEPADGSRWTPLYHAHDYERRVELYMQNVRLASMWAKRHRLDLLVVLQPSLAERARRTPREDELLEESLAPHESAAALRRGYEAMRAGLRGLAASDPSVHFLDAGRALDGEGETTFADLWHFSDPGHAALADTMADAIAPILRNREAR